MSSYKFGTTVLFINHSILSNNAVTIIKRTALSKPLVYYYAAMIMEYSYVS